MLTNCKVLVTGADGFIGSHLVQALARHSVHVRALSCYNSFNHWGWLEKIPELSAIEVITGDIRDANMCRRIMKDIDTVFHLAALVAIPYSYLAPESYLQTNVIGTANLCQAALDHGVQRFLHTSTSEVYGTAKYIPIDENHPLQPQSPYSASKIGAESVALSYFYSYRLPVTVVRPFNAYGPRQSARAIIPSIITQIAEGNTKIAIGNVAPTRDFTYVEDLCECFLRLATAPKAVGEIVNVGTGNEVTIGDLALLIASLCDKQIELVVDPQRLRPTSSEVNQLCCNPAKLKQLISFVPQCSLQEGLAKTIDWFFANANGCKPGLYHV